MKDYVQPPFYKNWSIDEFKSQHIVIVLTIIVLIALAALLWPSSDSSQQEHVLKEEGTVAAGLLPVLDSKSWVVTKIRGKKMEVGQAGAEIRSANEEGTECRMIVLSDNDYKEITFSYNRYTGKLYSPQLGEGKLEEGRRFYKLTITFEGWEISRVQ